mgnify:CR=1 FL=1
MKHWNELTPLERAHETYSDMYKDAYGFRPRNDVSNWTLADFEKEFEELGRVINADMEREEAEQERAINDFEARVRATIEAGAKVAYAFTEKLLGYLKLGYSWSKYSSPGYYQWINGPSYGIGVDYLITKNLFVRAEVSQQNYKTIYWSDGSSDKVLINSYGASIGWRF